MERLKPVLVTAPAVAPVTLADAKKHLNIDHSDDDALIDIYILAALSTLDGWTGILGRAIINQTWSESFDRFPCGAVLPLRLAPLQSVTSVKYRDADNTLQTFDSTSWMAVTDDAGPQVHLAWNASWPSTYTRPDAVTVEYVAGFGADADAVPGAIRSALLLLIGDLYSNRESTAPGVVSARPMPASVDMLLGPYRRLSL